MATPSLCRNFLPPLSPQSAASAPRFQPSGQGCTCVINHAVRPVLVFEQNGLTRTIHDPSWYQLLLHQAQA